MGRQVPSGGPLGGHVPGAAGSGGGDTARRRAAGGVGAGAGGRVRTGSWARRIALGVALRDAVSQRNRRTCAGET